MHTGLSTALGTPSGLWVFLVTDTGDLCVCDHVGVQILTESAVSVPGCHPHTRALQWSPLTTVSRV